MGPPPLLELRRSNCVGGSLRANIAEMIAVSQENVEKALDEIDKGGRFGVPRNRRSTQYCLVARGRHCPPLRPRARIYNADPD